MSRSLLLIAISVILTAAALAGVGSPAPAVLRAPGSPSGANVSTHRELLGDIPLFFVESRQAQGMPQFTAQGASVAVAINGLVTTVGIV
jgi:hypothetical protein